MEKPVPYPTRVLSGKPQVLLAGHDSWLTCETEEDAKILAQLPLLEEISLSKDLGGEQFALQLEDVAVLMGKYRMSFGARFFRRRAEEARKRGPK